MQEIRTFFASFFEWLMLFFKCGYFLKVLFNKRLSSPFFSVKSVARVQKKKSTTTKLMLMWRGSSNFQAHHSQSSCDPLRSIFFSLYFFGSRKGLRRRKGTSAHSLCAQQDAKQSKFHACWSVSNIQDSFMTSSASKFFTS